MVEKKCLFNLTAELRSYIGRVAEKRGESASALVRMILYEWVEKREKELQAKEVIGLKREMERLEAELLKVKLSQNRIEAKIK